MNWVDLESIITEIDYGITESATFKRNGCKFLRITDIREGIIDWDKVPYCICSENDEKKYVLQNNDIVFARTGSVGNTCLINNLHEKAVFASYLIRIRPNLKKINPDYLSLYFQSVSYWKQVEIESVGAIQGGLNASKLKKLKIPLPPLSDQQRIAIMLKKADRLRSLRKYARQLNDGYLQSVFLEMFGDPTTNPKGWKIIKLSEIGNLDRGKSKNRPRNAPFLFGGRYPFIQTGDIANSENYVTSYNQTYSERGLRQSKLWPKGTLCITIAANIAKTAILTFDACFPDSIVGFTPNPEVKTEYVQYWLSFLQKELEEKAPESAQKNINLEILRNLYIPLPPFEYQEKFSLMVSQFEKLKSLQKESERQTEMLFQSLLNMAFQ